MKNERNYRPVRPHGALTRALSLLLLGFIVYGTTVEAAHTHGALTAAKPSATSSSFSTPSEAKTANNLTGCGDCLICQLHQQFSTSVVAVPPTLVPASIASQHFTLAAVAVHSQIAAPRQGRAPPEAIL